MDNSYRIEMVKTQDARNAIDALLANKPVPVTHTGRLRMLDKMGGEGGASLERPGSKSWMHIRSRVELVDAAV